MNQEENEQAPNDEPAPATPDIIEKAEDTDTQKTEPPAARQDVMEFAEEPPKAKKDEMLKLITSINSKAVVEIEEQEGEEEE